VLPSARRASLYCASSFSGAGFGSRSMPGIALLCECLADSKFQLVSIIVVVVVLKSDTFLIYPCVTRKGVNT
jgi:hypothetical protein